MSYSNVPSATASSQPCQYDLLIIGGGINGAGIARDAAGRGLKVLLVEKDDLAQHTSSASTKLIHGGLRYLEYCDFRLVREALKERERLLKIAPHIIWPLHFVLPHCGTYRPAWMVRIGLFLYDHLSGKISLPKSRGVNLRKSPLGRPLKNTLKKGFVYSDCAVQDSRLVILNAMDAAEKGAEICPHTYFISAERQSDVWKATLRNQQTGLDKMVTVKLIINAAGPWVNEVILKLTGQTNKRITRLVRGSHIVVNRVYEGNHAYILQNPDKRIIFAIPYEHSFTLIGTTDIPQKDPNNPIKISQEEISYLCESMNGYFRNPIRASDIVWTFSGIRPLYDDGKKNASAITRDYVIELDKQENKAPVLSIFGGKITTYRRLAEHVLEKILPFFPNASHSPWTSNIPLPGGDICVNGLQELIHRVRDKAPFLEKRTTLRLSRSYGTKAFDIIGLAKSSIDMGTNWGEVTTAEVDYLMKHEWARSAEDILWRRSRMGLHLTKDHVNGIENYINQKILRDNHRL